MLIAHQYDPELAALIASELPPAVTLHALEQRDAFAVSPEAEALLINPSWPMHKDMPRPDGWPFGLRWVHTRSTGIDRFPPWLLEVELVTASRGAHAVGIAEYCLAAMLAREKQFPAIRLRSRAGWEKFALGGLSGKTLGLIGFGEIGHAIARRALAFEMDVLAYRRSATASDMAGVTVADLATVLSRADHLVLCIPHTAETEKLIDAGALALLKPSAHLVNVGRGITLDHDALHEALDAGRIAAATLDVTQPEPPPEGHWLYDHERVFLSAHLSASAPDTEARVNAIMLGNLAAFIAGRAADLHGLVQKAAGY